MSSSKYVRHQSVISRNADNEIEDDHWFKKFEKSLQKDAVQPRSVDQSLFHQINSIMNNKSKYPSVAAAVEDMKARSGLTAYLDKVKMSQDNQKTDKKKKTASDNNSVINKKVDMQPMIVSKNPQILATLENVIRDSKGNLSIPAIIDRVRSIHQNDVPEAKDWEDEKLMMLVSKLNLGAKKNNPALFENYSNLGSRNTGSNDEIDPSNMDAFHALNPVKF